VKGGRREREEEKRKSLSLTLARNFRFEESVNSR